MSLEDLFERASDGPRQSGQLQRRLRLLQVVLPCFHDAVLQYYTSAKKFSGTKAFWTKVLTACLSMELGNWRFDWIDEGHSGLVKLVLERLETVVGLPAQDIADGFQYSPFRRLESIRQKSALSDGIDIELLKPETAKECDELVESLKLLSVVMQDKTKQPLPEDVRVASRSSVSLAPLFLSLFSTMSKYWRCTCRPSHQAALLLSSNRTLLKNDSSASFTVLLSRSKIPKPTRRWQETGVIVCEQLPKSTVRIALPEPDVRQNTSVTDLCTTVKKSTARLNLNIEGALLSRQADTSLQMEHFEDCDLVKFCEGFLKNETELQIDGKVCLAVILSHAFLDFCGKPWFPEGWSKDSLYLMQRGESLFLQPFLVTNMHKESKISEAMKTSRADNLLRHGILLMEIFQQNPINGSLDSNGKPISLKDTADQVFKTIEWDICERFCQVVGACLQAKLTDSSSISCSTSSHTPGPSASLQPQLISEDDFSRLFCERIIAPLEADFSAHWQSQIPDQVISTLRLPSIKQDVNPSMKPNPRVVKMQMIPPSTTRRTKQSSPTLTPFTVKRPSLFFDVTDHPDSTQVKGALRWFQNFDDSEVKSRLPTRAATRNKRIKIAVLDTGIDLTNTWISQRAGRIQRWPVGEDCEDKDGHGTHVAHLLLRLAPHAQLHISKICKTRLLKDADVKRIAEAIVHFSTGKGRVDIISMSFGFPKYVTKLNPILSAIRTARTNGVIIFAAAGNEGGNRGVFWPAALHDGGNVIRINSSDGEGSPSGFNPSPEVGRRICTLGEGVPSCQLKDQLDMVHRSGTSFATPIAAAIAAIILGFMDNVDCSDFPSAKELLPRLRTAVGMEKVLCGTCVWRAGTMRSGFAYITPWYFLNREEKIRIPLILDILGEVPESPNLEVKAS